MLWTIVGFACLLAIVATVILKRQSPEDSAEQAEKWPYQPRAVLTEPEQVVYHRLVTALPECLVFPQVELSRVLQITQRSNTAAWHNRISGKSLDFVVCLKDSSVVAAIEIDDLSHNGPKRAKADEAKTQALQAAGIPLLHWKSSDLPDEAAIREAFTKD